MLQAEYLLASSGQGSLGHAAFLGIGGFVSSLLAINLGIPPVIGNVLASVFVCRNRVFDRNHMREIESMVSSNGNFRLLCNR